MRAFEQYFTETTTSFEQRNVSVADVDRVITEPRGFEEVILHLEAAPELFMAPRSDRLRVAACPVLIDQ
jgi:hypothetical protein